MAIREDLIQRAYQMGYNGGIGVQKQATVDDDSDSSSEEELTEHEKKIRDRINKVLDEFHLSRITRVAAQKWIKQIADPDNKKFDRLRSWMLRKMNGKNRAPPLDTWQGGCPEIFEGLRATPFWDKAAFPWLKQFEDSFDEIREELLSLRSDRSGFQPLRIPGWGSKTLMKADDGHGSKSHDSGDWNVFYLYLHEVKFPENCAKCPKTAALLETVPFNYQHAFFSALTPGTHIVKHHGPTNKKLRVHMPLLGVEGSELRVADKIHEGKAGECFVFDDSFEHEAWHKGDLTRLVLVFDMWHPDFSKQEVQFLSFLQRNQMRAEMKMEEQNKDGNESFYKLLKDAQDLLPNSEWWTTEPPPLPTDDPVTSPTNGVN